MICKYTKEKHIWINLLEIPEGEFDPGHSAWWCRGCGAALTQSELDNRTFDSTEYKPRIHETLEKLQNEQ